MKSDSFADDLSFLKQQGEVIELRAGGAALAVTARFAGRAMTSTATGAESFGWINRDYFAEFKAGRINPKISPFGGEDRFWMGPEGGQYTIFFKPGVPFEFANWETPPYIDRDPFEVVSSSADRVAMRRRVSLMNYSRTPFEIQIDREIRLVSPRDVFAALKIPESKPDSKDAQTVAFESDNRVTNAGDKPWTKAGGLLSIWIIGMFNASPKLTVVIPVQPGGEAERGPTVCGNYFCEVPADRLRTIDNTVYYKGDAQLRSKIGIGPKRVKPAIGSYCGVSNVLTLVQFSVNPRATEYVNSLWEQQQNPYAGDVVNSYTDGPAPDGGKGLGYFYELETSSAAYELKPGEYMQHQHRTIHFTGAKDALDGIAKGALGVGLERIGSALP